MKTIEPRQTIDAALDLPGSKSMTHRALISAALANGSSRIESALLSEDTLYTLKALQALGVAIETDNTSLLVSGARGGLGLHHPEKTVFIGNSGTSMRLLLSVAALGSGPIILDGSPRMRQRPIAPLVDALRTLGSAITYMGREGCPPVRVEAAGIQGGDVQIPGGESSQYISSLLLAAPFARDTLRIDIPGRLLSRPYVDMTLAVMGAFGVRVMQEADQTFIVPRGQTYRARTFTVEADVSSASYFWAAAAVTGGSVTTRNVRPFGTRQGDIGFLDLLEAMGCTVIREKSAVTVRGGSLTGIDADMGAMPDMVPTLAAVAPFAAGKTRIRNVPHLRHKESDRLRCVAQEWRRLGATIDELQDGLVIHGGQKLRGAIVDPHDDHRLAMSLAVMGLRTPDLRVLDETCVRKSFPGFWTAFDAL